MKSTLIILIVSLLVFMSCKEEETVTEDGPENEWTGEKIIFTKADSADWTLTVNQDVITDSIILTRANNRGLFNVASEVEFDNNDYTSPAGTEWAFGRIEDGVDNLVFKSWIEVHYYNPTNLLGADMVLHLIYDDVYIDIKFLSWTGGSQGGGFSYQRSTKN